MKKNERIAVFGTGLILLCIFTFTDLQISMVMFTKNIYGRVFEVVGEMPFVFLTLLGCCLLVRFRPKSNLAVNIFSAVFFGFFAVLFTFMGGFMTWNYLTENIGEGKVPGFIGIIIGAILLIGACLLASRVPEKFAHRAVTYGIIALIYFVLVIVVMNSLKTVWGRMRMREMTDPLTQFTPWYVITNRGGFNNIYASFPSGHSMNSAAIILSLLLPSFIPALAKHGKWLKIVTYAWLVMVASSRVVMGAHFASDVTVGVLLSLALFEITRAVVSKIRKENLLTAAAV